MVVDRYVYPGTNVFVNKLGIRDANELATAERRFTAICCRQGAEPTLSTAFVSCRHGIDG